MLLVLWKMWLLQTLNSAHIEFRQKEMETKMENVQLTKKNACIHARPRFEQARKPKLELDDAQKSFRLVKAVLTNGNIDCF